MRQLFQNLIGNALKFHKHDIAPTVSVSGRIVDDGTIEIMVSDNGIGFEAKHTERVFGTFQRLHGRSEYEGTGIGLSLCRKIIQRHHGQIKADPELRQIPVVVLTTSRAEEDILRTYDLGVSSFITKPVSFDGLVDVMRALATYWFEIVRLPAA